MKLYELFDGEKVGFQEWFQESIATKGKKPIVFYHGSNTIFKTFTTEYGIRYNTQAGEVPLFFTQEKAFAEDFGLHIYRCFLKVTKLFDGENCLKRHGYDIDEEDMTDLGTKLWNDLNNNKIFKFHHQENIYPTFLQIIANEHQVMEKNEMLKWLKQNGYDAFLGTGEGLTKWAVFSGKQVWIDRRLS